MAWLTDLARVMAPRGVAAISTHGYPVLDTIVSSKQHQEMYGLDQNSATRLRDTLPVRQWIFLPYGKALASAANVNGIEYGNSFTDPQLPSSRWTTHFEVASHIPGGLRGWQDIFLLRRKSTG